MKNKIYNLRYEDFIETENAFRKDKNLFVAEIDGREIKNEQDYFNKISDICNFPTISKSFGSHNDWIGDLDWLEKDSYAIIIYNYNEFIKDDLKAKNHIIENFIDFVLPWWETEVIKCVAEGKAKPFNVYLVDDVPESHPIRKIPKSTVNRADRERIRLEKEILLNPPEPEDSLWKFVNSGIEGNCKLFNINIFDYKWENTRQKINVLDPIYNQKHIMTVYKVNIGKEIFIFAAGEFSNGVYGFYIKEPDPIEIDVRNCVTADEIRDLLAKKLNLPEWDDNKPDDLFRLLTGLEPCEIHFIGRNIISSNISRYMNQIINIFYAVGEEYDIWIREINVKTIDFTGCKYLSEVHLRLKETLNFPDWYGENLDALWDLLANRTNPSEIHLKGLNEVSQQLLPEMQKILKVFKKAEEEYDYKIILG
ncbi:MAG: barstar family protein [Oscillospiraceae bacterium]|nr:barstar family protein [Oscillospiraceae bacterium]